MKLNKNYRNRSWIGTIPAEKFDQEAVEKALDEYTYIGQLERGTELTEANPEGYLHWQIYIENKNQIKLGTLINKLHGAHWEPRRGTRREAYEYCTKEDTSQGVQISNGTIDITKSEQGRRTDLEEFRTEILLKGKTANEVILEEPTAWRYAAGLKALETAHREQRSHYARSNFRDVHVSYIWGETGTGKTFGVYEKYGLENVFTVGEWRHPFDNYNGQEVLLLDEFYSSLPLEVLLKVLDKYPYELDARYGKRQAEFTKVVMTSNEPLSTMYLQEQSLSPRKWEALLRRIDEVQNRVSWTESVDETHLYKQTDKGEKKNEKRIEEKENSDIPGFSTCDILHGTYCACGAI